MSSDGTLSENGGILLVPGQQAEPEITVTTVCDDPRVVVIRDGVSEAYVSQDHTDLYITRMTTSVEALTRLRALIDRAITEARNLEAEAKA